MATVVSQGRRRGLGLSRGRQEMFGALPVYALMLLLVLLPLGYIAYASVQTASPGAPDAEFTWQHVRDVATKPLYWRVLGNSLWLGLLVAAFSVTLGVLLAWVLGRTDVPFKRTLSVLVSLPMFLSPFAGGIAWVILGSEKSGLINGMLERWFGFGEGWVNVISFPGMVFVMVLSFAPLAYLFTVGPMTNMDGSLEEASRMQGASLLRTMFKVTLPVVMPGVLSAFLMVFVLAAEMFSIPGLIGPAIDYRTLPFFVYQQTTTSPANWGGAAAAGLALLMVMMLGMLLQARAARASSRFVTVSGKGARPITMKLGKWRWPAAAIPVLYVFLGVVLPAVALFTTSFLQYYTPEFTMEMVTADHWRGAFESTQIQTALRNTVIIGSVTPTLALIVAFAIAYIRNRTKVPLRKTIETVGMLPIAMPGIVFGIGVLWAYVSTPLYGTIWLLVVAYCARYLPHALRVISSGLVQIDSGLEEASRVAGAGAVKTVTSINLPLLRNASLSSWLLLLIYCMRELNVAIMVYTSKSVVLPVLMWGAMTGGDYQEAAILALVESTLILTIVAIAALVFRVSLSSPRDK